MASCLWWGGWMRCFCSHLLHEEFTFKDSITILGSCVPLAGFPSLCPWMWIWCLCSKKVHQQFFWMLFLKYFGKQLLFLQGRRDQWCLFVCPGDNCVAQSIPLRSGDTAVSPMWWWSGEKCHSPKSFLPLHPMGTASVAAQEILWLGLAPLLVVSSWAVSWVLTTAVRVLLGASLLADHGPMMALPWLQSCLGIFQLDGFPSLEVH